MPRAPKQCGHTGCDERVTGRRWCDTHTALHQRRTNTTARGYGADHQAERTRWLPVIAAGNGRCNAQPCWLTTRHIPPGSTWHLGHNADRTRWTGPEHEVCNTRNAAQNKTRAATPPHPSHR